MWQVSIGTPYMACFYNGCVVFMNKEFDIIEEELNKLSFFTNVGKGLVYGRDRMDIFLEKAGHPEKAYRIIQIAGTNGKGSVSSYISGGLRSLGFKTGTFTSPHLVDIRERIVVNGEYIPVDVFVRLYYQVKDIIASIDKEIHGFNLGYFEYLQAMTLIYYVECGIDVLVMETGLGGRHDSATSLVNPDVCVLVSLGLDHTAILGDTYEKIAYEKSGIMRDGADVVSVYPDINEEVNKAIEDIYIKEAINNKCNLTWVYKNNIKSLTLKGGSIDFSLQNDYYKNVIFKLDTPAIYQAENASVALTAIAVFLKRLGRNLNEQDVLNLQDALYKVHWSARMQCIGDGIYLDGAHNPEGIKRFVESAGAITDGAHATLVFSAVSDKNFWEMINTIVKSRVFSDYVITELNNTSRALDKDVIKNAFILSGTADIENHLIVENDVYAAIRNAIKYHNELKCEEDRYLFFVGSLYLAAIVEDLIKEEKQ